MDFTLTTGIINIGPVNSILKVAKGVTFTNNGTINAEGDLINDGITVNNGTYNNEATIITSSGSATFTNNLGGLLNNLAGGTSVGVITNACGGVVNDQGGLDTVSLAPCIWSEAGGNDNWSNPFNWANGLLPPKDHPVVFSGEGSTGAKVVVDFDLVIDSRTVTVGAGDTLTVGTGSNQIP